MKAVKIIAAILLSIALLIGEGLAFGFFSVDEALSEDTIRQSIDETDVISELVDEALSENTVNMGGKYGEMIAAVFKTEAMKDFFTDYMTAAIRGTVYGETPEEVADDELMGAFSRGIDELNASGEMSVSAAEEEVMKLAMAQEVPDLTAQLNSNFHRYDATSGQVTGESLEVDDDLQTMMGTGVRIVVILVCMALCAGLIALFWRSKLGFIWCAAVTALVAGIFGLVYFIGGEVLLGMATAPSDELVLRMVDKGFGTMTVAALIVTAIFVILYVVLRRPGRRKTT